MIRLIQAILHVFSASRFFFSFFLFKKSDVTQSFEKWFLSDITKKQHYLSLVSGVTLHTLGQKRWKLQSTTYAGGSKQRVESAVFLDIRGFFPVFKKEYILYWSLGFKKSELLFLYGMFESCGLLYLSKGKHRPGGATNIHYDVSKPLCGNNGEGCRRELRPARVFCELTTCCFSGLWNRAGVKISFLFFFKEKKTAEFNLSLNGKPLSRNTRAPKR